MKKEKKIEGRTGRGKEDREGVRRGGTEREKGEWGKSGEGEKR